DKPLIAMVKKMMGVSNAIEEYQPLTKNRKRKYVLQIGSRRIYERLIELGFTEKKSLTLKFPSIPDEFLCHFVRGYLDGDGCVFFGKYKRHDRKKDSYVLMTSFTCGSRKFLVCLKQKLQSVLKIRKGGIYTHGKNAYNLAYSIGSARQLYNFMYPTTTVPHLGRKKAKFEKAFAVMGP
ncbi:MAG: hypothetical protein HYZ63_02980, partial [Candidatus Andersenbacteria bacterium]|nr:hypothetical protein [Candidatus Andersenbacteria bacterium]